LALPTSGDRSVGIVRWRSQVKELVKIALNVSGLENAIGLSSVYVCKNASLKNIIALLQKSSNLDNNNNYYYYYYYY
jgi:hypothetical protein